MKTRTLASPSYPAGARQYALDAGRGLRCFAISFAALLSLSPVAAPVLAARGAAAEAGLIYLGFAPACHQRPERSFEFNGHPWAVCHRCSGVYWGLLAGVALPRTLLRALLARRRPWTLAAAAVLLADFLANYSPLLTNSSWSRFVSGFGFGTVGGALVLAGLAELFEGQRTNWRAHPSHGGAR